MEWQLIEIAPKDGTRIDIVAKRWQYRDDKFIFKRFTDCYWSKGDPECNRKPDWENVEGGYRPTHWMPIPELPEEDCAPRQMTGLGE